MLTEVTDGGRPYFTVVDRRTLQNAMAEMKLQQAGFVDEKTISRLGRFIGVSGIYAGSADIPNPVNKMHQEKRFECADRKCKNRREVTMTCTERLVQYTLSPRLVDVATSEVIYQRSVAKSESSSFCSESVGDSSEVLLARARDKAFAEVRKDIAPFSQSQSLRLKTSSEGLSGDARTRFSDSLVFAEAGRMDRACDVWSTLVAQGATSLALSYDLAVCAEAGGRLQEALSQYTVIDQSLSRPDDDVNAALVRVRARIADEIALSVQQTTPSTATSFTNSGGGAGGKVPRSAR